MPGPGEWVVDSIYRYPVKSMRGEQPSSISFEDGHVAGDRQWAVVDPASGFMLSAKRHGALLEAAARIGDAGGAVITLPDGSELVAGEPGADEALSEWLGRHVELRQPGNANVPYEGLADFLDETSEVTSVPVPENHFADVAEAHLLTLSSLGAAAALHPAGDWDLRRFRPTMLIAGDGEGFVEDGWIGSTVAIGEEVRLDVFAPTIRCSMPTRAQPGIPRDTQVARVLRDQHGFCLGVYAAARQRGTVRAGDAVTVISG